MGQDYGAFDVTHDLPLKCRNEDLEPATLLQLEGIRTLASLPPLPLMQTAFADVSSTPSSLGGQTLEHRQHEQSGQDHSAFGATYDLPLRLTRGRSADGYATNVPIESAREAQTMAVELRPATSSTEVYVVLQRREGPYTDSEVHVEGLFWDRQAASDKAYELFAPECETGTSDWEETHPGEEVPGPDVWERGMIEGVIG